MISADRAFVELLWQLGHSLLITVYDRQRVILFAPNHGDKAVDLIPAARPLGLACDGTRLAMAGHNSIALYHRTPHTFDRPVSSNWLPQSQHVTGYLDAHELAFGELDDRPVLWFVNTLFDCVATLADGYSFSPYWSPPGLVLSGAYDQRHLNGLAMRDGLPAYATALADSTGPSGWRSGTLASSGVVYDIAANSVLFGGLALPHSPRWHEGALYVLAAGRGELLRFDGGEAPGRVVAQLPGFARGLAIVRGVAFVGVSSPRHGRRLPVFGIDHADHAGVYAIELETGRLIGVLAVEEGAGEVFAVEVLEGQRPALLSFDDPAIDSAYVLQPELLTKELGYANTT